MSTAWVIRSGRRGERDSWALSEGVSGGGWSEIPDLTSCTSRQDVAKVVATRVLGASDARIANYTGQLWALRSRIEVGDLLVMPLKTTKQIAIGRVTAAYHYLANQEDPYKRHVVGVNWIRTDLPRASVKQDLLFTLGSAMSIFAPSKNNAVARLQALLDTGQDPGQAPGLPAQPELGDDVEDVDEPEALTDIEQVAYDQITLRIGEDFAGHDLATLITELLEADGMKCKQAPPGPDGGIDIIAGRDLLGLDDPVLVQVKSGAQVGSPVVSQLHGVMVTHGARQGLLVAWGGLSKPAWDALKSAQLRVRVWEASDVVDAVLANYDRLSEDVRAALPLKRVWMLADGAL